jgi:hypothetical protein
MNKKNTVLNKTEKGRLYRFNSEVQVVYEVPRSGRTLAILRNPLKLPNLNYSNLLNRHCQSLQ